MSGGQSNLGLAAQLLLSYRRGEDSVEALAGAMMEASYFLSHIGNDPASRSKGKGKRKR